MARRVAPLYQAQSGGGVKAKPLQGWEAPPLKLDRTQIAGLVGFAVIFALGIGLGVAVAELPAPPGDVLSFAGALIGAALAVIGAVYVFEHQRVGATTEARKVLSELLQDVLDRAAKVREPDANEDYSPAIVVLANVDTLKEAIAAVKQARQWFAPTTGGMVRAYAHIELLSVDKEQLRKSMTPQLFYGGMPQVAATDYDGNAR